MPSQVWNLKPLDQLPQFISFAKLLTSPDKIQTSQKPQSLIMATEEKTFRTYSAAQGDSYAIGRPGYASDLFRIIVDHHVSTGGQLNLAVDAGCGTGQATRDLSRYFDEAIGLDPSIAMVQTARASLTSNSTEDPVRFEVSTGEDLGANLKPSIADGSVDLLTAATAAHWFDMTRFWASAARVLKPGGTVALWARTAMAIDPTKTPNGRAIRAVADEISTQLSQYSEAGGMITSNLYAELPLPWNLQVPVEDFDQETFIRQEWNKSREYQLPMPDEKNLGVTVSFTAAEYAKLLNTHSSMSRWRDANPETVGTKHDLVISLQKRMEKLLSEVGEAPNSKVVRGGTAIVLLMIKKCREP